MPSGTTTASAATQLGAIAEAATVRERMGHGSLTVSSIYTHRVSAADRAAAEHVGRILDESRTVIGRS